MIDPLMQRAYATETARLREEAKRFREKAREQRNRAWPSEALARSYDLRAERCEHELVVLFREYVQYCELMGWASQPDYSTRPTSKGREMNKLVKRNTLIVGDVFRSNTRPGEVNLVVAKNLERLLLLRMTDGEVLTTHAGGEERPHRFWAEADWPGEVEYLGHLHVEWEYNPSVDQLREVLSPFPTPDEAASDPSLGD